MNARTDLQPPPLETILLMLHETLQHPRKELSIDERLWDAQMVGSYLGVSNRYVTEHYACLPDFPAAILLPTPTGTKAARRWKAEDVRKWVERRQETKRKVA